MKLAVTILAVYALILALVAVNQRRLMYHPDHNLQAPEHYGLRGVTAGKLSTKDEEFLDYWYVAAKGDKPVILYFHGNGGHLGYRANFFDEAMKRGYGLFMLSYRGYGTSTGTPSEQGFYEDAGAAYLHLRQDLQIPEEQLIIYGESIGTGVATEIGRGKSQVKAMVLQAPFTSVRKRASEIYWWLPVSVMIQDKYDSLSKVEELKMPILIMAAENDYIVPARHAEQLYQALETEKKFHMFKGIGHNDFSAPAIFDLLQSSGY